MGTVWLVSVLPDAGNRYIMNRTRHMLAVGAVLATALTQWLAAPSLRARPAGQSATVAGNPAPTDEQIRSLIARTVENQHRNDRAIEEFERIERVITRKAGASSDKDSDRTDRVLPSGTGTMKLQVAENGTPVSPELYRHDLQYAVSALNLAIHPNERYKQDLVKFEKRNREHAELVDTSVKAFRMKWAGRETRPDPAGTHASRTLAKFLLEPDPNYKPTNRLAFTFEHVRATLWVDENQAQFARLEGDITSDITFVGGIAGKIYHGGHFTMEQSEVAPGVWLPTLYTYDVDGRRFVFGFGLHERTEITNYRRVGPPAQAIELIRSELNSLSAQTPGR
jgi:hypothetical protein